MSGRDGGCLCGDVRYRIVGEPVVARICWCSDCLHIAGNGTANAIFAADAVSISGAVAEYVRTADSGNHIHQQFCARCGSHLFARSSGRPGFVVVRVGTLDDPSSIRPRANIWTTHAPAWACMDSALEQFEGQPVFTPPPS